MPGWLFFYEDIFCYNWLYSDMKSETACDQLFTLLGNLSRDLEKLVDISQSQQKVVQPRAVFFSSSQCVHQSAVFSKKEQISTNLALLKEAIEEAKSAFHASIERIHTRHALCPNEN